MPLSPSPVALRNRRILVALVASLLVAVGVMWWLSGADERRVNSACDTWLEQRSSLRTVLSETEEAVGRAQAEGSSEAPPGPSTRS